MNFETYFKAYFEGSTSWSTRKECKVKNVQAGASLINMHK